MDIEALRRAKAYLRDLVAAEIGRKPGTAKKVAAKMGEFGSDAVLAGNAPSVNQWLASTSNLGAQVQGIIEQAKLSSKFTAEIPKFSSTNSKKQGL